MKRELVMIKAEQTESRTPLRLGTSWDSFMRMFDVMPRKAIVPQRHQSLSSLIILDGIIHISWRKTAGLLFLVSSKNNNFAIIKDTAF